MQKINSFKNFSWIKITQRLTNIHTKGFTFEVFLIFTDFLLNCSNISMSTHHSTTTDWLADAGRQLPVLFSKQTHSLLTRILLQILYNHNCQFYTNTSSNKKIVVCFWNVRLSCEIGMPTFTGKTCLWNFCKAQKLNTLA